MQSIFFSLLFLFFLLMLYTVGSSEVTTNAEPPIGIKQEVSANCQTMQDCPDYLNEKQWDRYQTRCCSQQMNRKFHCIEFRDSQNLLHVVKACVDPVTCEAGEN